ncbi:hypothetical protein HUO09_16880 [Vibrio sp. Y2-5]|uniref:RAQPRD family integrative conjugative element protein n=1 Tax=Vibrio sp. Y2-5 TaxID=2743977 RepID=UPI0016607945|nr:RAQPRD family integrative conjugative element protein [Vibrio sp. Y2-5]MBD0788030.1 hypothetical protein [Vibrio sp. Y2-5]
MILKHSILLCVAALSLPQLAHADVWQERELLERWATQTESLNEILDEAQYSADMNRRAKMDYSALRKDIRETLLKVRHYLDAPAEPFNRYKAEQNQPTISK